MYVQHGYVLLMYIIRGNTYVCRSHSISCGNTYAKVTKV